MKPQRHLGMTLVELLVVVALSSVLLAISVSSLRGSFEDRKLRETTRIINAAVARESEGGGDRTSCGACV